MTHPNDPGRSGASDAFVLAANPLAIRAGLARIMASAPLARLPPAERGLAEIVLAEVLNNIAEHAYAAAPGNVEIVLRQTPDGLQCQITDDGLPMPGGQLPPGHHPALRPGDTDLRLGDLPEADLPEGGFGWHMIHRLTRDLAYRRIGQQNRLTFLIPA